MADSTAASPPPRYVVAFRTHVWDAPAIDLAGRMARACRGGTFVVLADETHGRLDVAPYRKISHTDDLTGLGLPREPPGQVLWYNGDYPLYALARAMPRFDYYVMAEYDVSVNDDLDSLLSRVGAGKLDLVGHDIRRTHAGWLWYPSVAPSFTEPWEAFLAFAIYSRAAVRALLTRRRALGQRRVGGRLAAWPYCEGFIPSVICGDPAMKWAELGEFTKVENYAYRPLYLLGEANAHAPGSIAHPVLPADRLIEKFIVDADPEEFLKPESKLNHQLARIPLALVAPHLQQRWLGVGHAAAVAALRDRIDAAGLRGDPRLYDLALGKPALQSSISEWSRGSSPAEDAAGLVNGPMADDFANHTAREASPWWSVDLLEEHVIDEIWIVNRTFPGPGWRLRRFSIDTSRDGITWTTRTIKLDDDPVSCAPEDPHRVVLSTPCVGRHVRITQLDHDYLHLRRVHVFGRAIMPSNRPLG